MRAAFVHAVLALALTAPVSAAEISVRIEPERLTVGDELRVVCLVRRAAGESVQPLVTPQNVHPWELKGVRTVPAGSGADGAVTERVEIVLTIFETGEHVLPPLPISVRPASGESSVTMTPERKITVQSILTPKDKTLRPIKGPATLGLRTLLLTLAALAAAVLIAGLIAAVVLRPRKPRPDPELLLPADERARRELSRLRQASHLAQGRFREHYSGLADIARRFLERRYGVDVMERTTGEILRSEPVASLEAETRSALRELLDAADLVKFARATPDRTLTVRLEESLTSVVARLAPPPAERVKGRSK
ncbi:MAG: hypothetical protein MOGMAGMI_01748 [Candidatus Omnitrophica bacterium]|nr:hypothetical protein [Candidatus Omnitrophota bacterium]